MTFFVCFNLLLGFLIKGHFFVYVNDTNNKDNSSKPGAPQHILDLEKLLNEQHKQRKADLESWKQTQESLDKEKKSKQDSSNVVNDGSEPTPLTDLDGGD